MPPVHPRPRGEHHSGTPPVLRVTGSSPPARGTPLEEEVKTLDQRFIPARAGNTVSAGSNGRTYVVHPRPRGEHRRMVAAAARNYGSSPPARGTHDSLDRPRTIERFIPARAGNTWKTRIEAMDVRGSSPPARGTLRGRVRLNRKHRFIPARAGNTSSHRLGLTPMTVHPRPRGEHCTHSVTSRWTTGSSPPARGTPSTRHDDDAVGRFIPARAGNTFMRPTPPTKSAVHPRPRGEHSPTSSSDSPTAGSSPPARGTPDRGPGDLHASRFIPARAGNTASPRTLATTTAVHPRPRGEHAHVVTKALGNAGSSPPARGTLEHPPDQAFDPRFIPARAGNTLGSLSATGY